ncbi:MAG TPA: RNA methyltransferase [Candidatus Acidoferrales bacterium]|nr:RNA methyltransferase [Candidatus Acidoferrales bacterium]
MPSAAQLDRLRVVLVCPRNPLNIGAAARAMSNFGVRRLRVVNPYQPAFREAKSAVGAADVLASAEQFKTVAEAVADCTLVVGTTAVGKRNLHHPLRRLEDGARLIRRGLGKSGVALLFGSEKFGLSNDDLSYCHWVMRVPTVEKNISMNLDQAVAVCLYELIRDAKSPRITEKRTPASAAEVERITTLLLDALNLSGFTSLRRVADSDERIRRLVRRLNLLASDAVIWQGIFRQIAWKLRNPPHDSKADTT